MTDDNGDRSIDDEWTTDKRMDGRWSQTDDGSTSIAVADLGGRSRGRDNRRLAVACCRPKRDSE
ncbi:unnamed protein product [Soboliphyme baturini]|uniref:Transposase n=1 Tax=Soboliphyme baturini TaxID=241478 RepID=A0A183IWB7_9BILA|nr:unnamed protein product [Soboliphyme baturini]